MEVHIKIYGQNVAVEVSVEIGEYLNRSDHQTENLFHEQRRHWDGREFDEYIAHSGATCLCALHFRYEESGHCPRRRRKQQRRLRFREERREKSPAVF